jgi:hypothetical protein
MVWQWLHRAKNSSGWGRSENGGQTAEANSFLSSTGIDREQTFAPGLRLTVKDVKLAHIQCQAIRSHSRIKFWLLPLSRESVLLWQITGCRGWQGVATTTKVLYKTQKVKCQETLLTDCIDCFLFCFWSPWIQVESPQNTHCLTERLLLSKDTCFCFCFCWSFWPFWPLPMDGCYCSENSGGLDLSVSPPFLRFAGQSYSDDYTFRCFWFPSIYSEELYWRKKLNFSFWCGCWSPNFVIDFGLDLCPIWPLTSQEITS